MPVEDANKLIAAPWTLLAEQFTEKILTALNSVQVKQSNSSGATVTYNVNLQLGGFAGTVALAAAPGISQQTNTLLEISAPLDPAGWSVNLNGLVNGNIDVKGLGATLLSKTITNQNQSIDVSGVRIVAGIESGDFTATNPTVSQLSLTPNITVALTGFVNTNLSINAASTVTNPDGSLQFEITLSDLDVTLIRGFTVSGTIIVVLGAQLTIDPKLEIDIDGVKIPFGATFSANLPESILQLVQLVNSQQKFGQATAEAVQPVPNAASALASEASLVEQSIQDHAPNGLIYSLQFPPGPDAFTPAPGPPLYYTDEEDCAIWTGHYLAAESFRYAAAVKKGNAQEKADALTSVNAILSGIEKLFAITEAATSAVAGDAGKLTGLLCRAALPDSSAIQTTSPLKAPAIPSKYYISAQIDGEPWSALGRGIDPPSRDSHIGILLGLGCAFQLVTEPAVQSQVSDIFTPFLGYLLQNNWNVPTPTGDPITVANGKIVTTAITSFLLQFHQQLALLKIGALVNPGAFAAAYAASAGAADMAWIPVWGDCLDPVAKYYKFNLDHAALGLLCWLENDATIRAGYLRAFGVLRDTVHLHRNAYFDLWQILVDPASATTVTDGASLQDEVVYLLSQLSDRFNNIQGPNSNLPREVTPDTVFISGLDQSTVTTYTSLFSGEVDVVVRYPLPVNVRPGCQDSEMDYIWQREPFGAGFVLGSDGKPEFGQIDPGDVNTESPGIDYLLAYYMASYAGLV